MAYINLSLFLGTPSSNSTVPETVERVVTFIKNVAAARAMPMPGRLPNSRDMTGMKLPSDMTKVSLYREYVNISEEKGEDYLGLTAFKDIWTKYVPEIAIMKPATDLCLTCQQNTEMLQKYSTFSNDLKQEKLQAVQEHREEAYKQRDHYNKQCALAKSEIHQDHPKCMTYSFDFAQNVVYPSNPLQPGAAYFRTPKMWDIWNSV